jgi:alkylhydroperoxidase/carboxymuconolactone decarboxylase family protein YurZ
MSEHIPDVYKDFRRNHPEVAHALDALGAATGGAGPLDERTQRLVKLGIAVGSEAEGAVRSDARRAIRAGATPEDLRHVALLAITTASFPTAIAGLSWIEEVLRAED